ncbi:MAG: DUF937 domain-containing protein [Culturomica sp.]|jgi:outer membrane protein OmpA-like peptidoglycan-associated protein|nr:DUF937 domain-containing protein [Culturomica sp.]
MMQYFNSLKSLFPGDMISKTAAMLDEQEVKVSTAVSTIVASFLEVIRKKGNNPEMENIWKEAGHKNILSHVAHICQENVAPEHQALGDNFLEHLLGDKAAAFTDPIAAQTAVSKPVANRLVSMMAPIVAGFFGNLLVKEKYSMHTIFTELESQKECSLSLVPAGIRSAFKSGSTLEHKSHPHHTHHAAAHAAPVAAPASPKTEKPKTGKGWLVWLLLILLLLLLLFFWRSCRKHKARETLHATETVIAPLPPVVKADTGRKSLELVLPNGVKLNAYTGGIEDRMIAYLNSDAYKNATAKELEDKWFVFDNIRFEFNSATDLMNHSMVQVNNIAEILKAYGSAKILIAGFADKVGSKQDNISISRGRAKTIEKLLDQQGLQNQIVRTEGYGNEFAKHAASESDDARSEDRDIALRFVK